MRNPILKFGRYIIDMMTMDDITFNLYTDKKLWVYNYACRNLTLKGKMDLVRYKGYVDHLKVEGDVADVIDSDGNSILPQVYNYDDLPDIYESLSDRLRRLTV